MKKHFVTFLSPGTLFNEESTVPIDSWDVDKACELAHTIKERYGATPFAFYFSTRGRNKNELDSKKIANSPKYYLGGQVKTLKEVEAENDPGNDILISNMKCNKWRKIIVNTNSWQVTQPLESGDVILDWIPRKK